MFFSSMFLVLLQVVFWMSGCLLFYIYFGFPLSLYLLTRRCKHQEPRDLPDEELPTVSLLVAAYNEELVIERKLQNCLTLDYPHDKLKFVFVSDSTDKTNEILLRHRSERFKVLMLPERGGKVKALRQAFPLCAGEIIVFSDANTYYWPDSIRKLVRHFQSLDVGAVTGDVRLLPTDETFGKGESLYYRYERHLQLQETLFWSTVTVDGAMYALRRELFDPPTSGVTADDLVTGMNVACRGFRVIYDPAAVAEEEPTPTNEQEFNRKIRMVSYGIQSVIINEGMPSIRQFRIWWTFVSHKVLRWLAPVFLVSALVSSIVAAILSPVWIWVVAPQVIFYFLGVLASLYPWLTSRLFRVPYYFTLVNVAALVGIIRGARRKPSLTWTKAERAARPRG